MRLREEGGNRAGAAPKTRKPGQSAQTKSTLELLPWFMWFFLAPNVRLFRGSVPFIQAREPLCGFRGLTATENRYLVRLGGWGWGLNLAVNLETHPNYYARRN